MSPTQLTNIQRIAPSKITNRERSNPSQSPEDSQRGGGAQRIALNNISFIPAKAQMHAYNQSNNANHNESSTNISFLDNSNQNSQNGKISPTRIQLVSNGKVMIPGNQIKFLKKGDNSPSPDNRVGFAIQNMKQVSGNGSPTVLQLQQQKIIMKARTAGIQSKLHQTSDDETNVQSDNEEDQSQSNFQNIFQHDSSINKFNRPKIKASFGQSQLSPGHSQNSSRPSQDKKVKIISAKQIRNSPSPTPSQMINNTQTPLQILQPKQQQPAQQQLASDFIKDMIAQNRSNGTQPSNNTLQQKSVIGQSFKLKKQNFIQSPQSPTNKDKNDQPAQVRISPKNIVQQKSFVSEMKKLGIMKDLQDVTQMNQLLSENSPIRQLTTQGDDQQPQPSTRQNILVQKANHQRNLSPPPNFQTNATTITNIHRISTKENDKDLQASKVLQQQIKTDQEENDQTNNTQNSPTANIEGGNVFQFPFQRRARSLSITKNEGSTEANTTTQNIGTNPTQTRQTKSPSPVTSQKGDETKRNRPVIAKTNFVIAHQALMGVNLSNKDEEYFEKTKEVEEWLLGSGGSDETTGSSTSNKAAIIQKKQQELEKPVQPIKQDDIDSGGEEEDWMFKTFEGFKGSKKKSTEKENKVPAINNVQSSRIACSNRITEVDNFCEDIAGDDSPFDMAPEMSKQFSKGSKPVTNDYIMDELIHKCDNLNDYMDQFDALIENKYIVNQ